MLASLAKPVTMISNVCSGATHWAPMSPFGALLLISIFMPMFLIPSLISSICVHITCACMVITITLFSKGSVWLNPHYNAASVLAPSVIPAILFFHLNVFCITSMLILLNIMHLHVHDFGGLISWYVNVIIHYRPSHLIALSMNFMHAFYLFVNAIFAFSNVFSDLNHVLGPIGTSGGPGAPPGGETQLKMLKPSKCLVSDYRSTILSKGALARVHSLLGLVLDAMSPSTLFFILSNAIFIVFDLFAHVGHMLKHNVKATMEHYKHDILGVHSMLGLVLDAMSPSTLFFILSNAIFIVFYLFAHVGHMLKHNVKAIMEHYKHDILGSTFQAGCKARFPRVSPSLIFFIIIFSLFSNASAVCIHCKDSIDHADGDANCPLIAGVAANVALFKAGTLGNAPVIKDIVPPFLSNLFPRPVVEAIVAIACKPVSGGAIDFSTAAYGTAKSVVQAACYGHCSMDAAMIELSARLDSAEDALAVSRISANIEMLSRKSSDVISSMHGVFTFVWAKLGQIFTASTSVKLSGGSSSAKASDLTATIRRPSSSEEFFETIHYFTLMVHALGLVSISLVSTFIADVVYKTIRELKETWQLAHEYLLLMFERIENDATRRLHFGNVLDNGGQDTMLAKARVNVAAFFRPRGENPQLGGAKKFNGKFDKNAKQACVAYNNDKEHNASSLSADGSCRFNHVCNQFVSDKGPAGMCWAAHPRCKCSYDTTKRLNSPQK